MSCSTSRHPANKTILRYLKLLWQNALSQFSPAGEKIRPLNELLKRISAEGKPILIPYGEEKVRIWSQETSGKLQPKGGSGTAQGPCAHHPTQTSPPWQQGQSLQKWSHLVSSKVVPLQKLLHMSFISIMDKNTSDCSIGYQISMLAHIILLFSMLLDLPKTVTLMKTGWNL